MSECKVNVYVSFVFDLCQYPVRYSDVCIEENSSLIVLPNVQKLR